MRTISTTLLARLVSQAEEADFQGLTKVASSLSTQIGVTPVREDNEEYTYSQTQLEDDVQTLLWAAAMRAQDYFNRTADAAEMADLIETQASELIEAVRRKTGNRILGPFEPTVPGEDRIEVEIDE
jgi:hypothetical protein